MSNEFQEYLKTFDKNRVVSIYCDPESISKFSAGFIGLLTNNEVLIKHVTSLGAYDGYAVIKIGNILRIDSHGIYEKKLEMLYRTQKAKHPENIGPNDRDISSNLFFEMLRISKQKRFVISTSIDISNQESITGFVKEINKKAAIIDRLTIDGFSDGETIIEIKDIEKMYCDAEDDRTLGFLNDLRKKEK